MHNDPNYKPRLNVEIREDQLLALQRLLPYGLRKMVFEYVIDQIIALCDADLPTFISAIVSKTVKLNELIDLEKK